jgi:hypothetical protein
MSCHACRPIPRNSSMSGGPTSGSPRTRPHGARLRPEPVSRSSRNPPVVRRANPRPLLLKWPAGVSWECPHAATVGHVRVEPGRRRSGAGPGRDAGGRSGPASGMSHVTHTLASIRATRRPLEPLLPPAYLPEPIEGAEADRAAGPFEKTPALSRHRPGAHVRG